MYSHLDREVLSARVYLTKPPGNYFMYEVVDEQFVVLTDHGDHHVGNRINIEDAKELIARGYKVWVVSSSPIEYDT